LRRHRHRELRRCDGAKARKARRAGIAVSELGFQGHDLASGDACAARFAPPGHFEAGCADFRDVDDRHGAGNGKSHEQRPAPAENGGFAQHEADGHHSESCDGKIDARSRRVRLHARKLPQP
jgi:hypothetical protein